MNWKCLAKTMGVVLGGCAIGLGTILIIVFYQFWGFISIMGLMFVVMVVSLYQDCVLAHKKKEPNESA